ncbi:MAG: hypothetical protein ACMXYF_05035 [Candidatus Woesearchaeota archaeon]
MAVIESLKEMALIKQEEVFSTQLTKRNVSVYFSLYYDAIRELLEAFCLKKGYKVLNHVCLGEKVKEISQDFDYSTFDRIRYLRNGINYYGNQIAYEPAVLLLKKIKKLFLWILQELNK